MGGMDRDGLTVVHEASAPIVTALAGEPVGEPTVEPAAAQPVGPAAARPGEQAAGQPAKQRRRGTFRALSSKPFRRYFAGQVASASGTFLQQTAMGWLVLKLTGNAASLGLVLAAGGVPSLLFGPWGGTIADRVDLRRLLIGTQLAFGLLAGLLWARSPSPATPTSR
jgi:predicted MFS family arabinose efflux permease